ncbi:MAG: hypothetical protein ACRC1P_11025 [Cellulosilyticaceae bacterium]
MFILGLNAFGGNKVFDSNVASNEYEYLSIENGSYNCIRVDAEVQSPYGKPMKDWEATTVLLGNFNESLECGNLQQNGQGIQSLRFKKRPKGSLDWLFIDELPYKKEQNLYTVHDRLAFSQEEYEYCLIPITNGVEGGYVVDSTVCEFTGLWAVDRFGSAKLMYDLEYGEIDNKRNISVFETLERRYPIIQSSGTQYRTGSNAATVVSNSTMTGQSKYGIDYLSDRKVVDKTVDFLANRRPKIIKDGNGRQYLVMVSDVRESSGQSWSGGLSKVAFNWTEIGDASSLEDLIDFDLMPEMVGGN